MGESSSKSHVIAFLARVVASTLDVTGRKSVLVVQVRTRFVRQATRMLQKRLELAFQTRIHS